MTVENKKLIEEMDAEIDNLQEIIDQKAKTFNWANAQRIEDWENLISTENKRIGELSRKIRLIQEPEMSEIPDYGDHMTLKDFIKNVKSGGFINSDGYGNYATETQCSNIDIYPSDIKKDQYRKDFTHIVWYNR